MSENPGETKNFSGIFFSFTGKSRKTKRFHIDNTLIFAIIKFKRKRYWALKRDEGKGDFTMILTEDREYMLSLELERSAGDTGLTGGMAELRFTNAELLHAIITCSMPIQRLTPPFAEKRKMELLYKIFLVETALEAEGDRLMKSRRTAYLESAEKSAVSYYLGLFFTKLISSRQYGVDYLTHLNLIEEQSGRGYIEYFAKDWRQDMIGYHTANDSWSVWEAKGGSNRREPALKKGCQQAADIAVINGKIPEPSVVCMTYYDHGHLCAVVRETGENLKNGIEKQEASGTHLTLSTEHFYAAYYRTVVELFQEQGVRINGDSAEVWLEIPYFHSEAENTDGRTYSVYQNANRQERFAVQNAGSRKLRIGMNCALLQALTAGRYEEAARIRKTAAARPGDGQFAGADGVYIR